MTKPIPIPFNGPAYETESAFVSSQICRNFYPRSLPGATGEGMVLFGTPGLEIWVYFGPGEIRGSIVFGDLMYLVHSGKLYKITPAGIPTVLGNIGSSAGLVGMATNGQDLIIVDGVSGYVWDYSSSTLTEITDPDFPTCNSVVFTDGYYLVPKADTGEIWRSDFNDGLSWGGLAFSSAGADPDPIVAIALSNKDVYTIGEKTTEIWINTGAATFNFSSIPGAFIQKGCVGIHAVAVGNNAVYWVGRDEDGHGQLIQCVGRSPKVVSTTPITREFQSWGDLSDLQLLTYEQLGHTHVVITSPSEGKTFVYDSTMGQWHERSSMVAGVDSRWRINTHSFFSDSHIVGDWENGKLYKMETELYDEDGDEIRAVRRTPVIRDNQNRITVNKVQVITEPGVGLSSGEPQDIDPHATFRWSRDGGRTWPMSEDLPLGKIGETENEVQVLQLGQGRNWVFEITITARVKRVIMGATAEVMAND